MRADIRTEQRRTTLLQSALELFVEKGFHETKVSDIVERAGVAQGTFYLYFPGKRDAFDALMAEWFEPFLNIIQASTSFEPADFSQAVERARSDITAIFDSCQNRPLLTRLMLKQAEGVGSDVSERMEQFREQIAAHVEHILGIRQEAGLMRPFQAKVVAHGIVGMVERVAFRWFVMHEAPPLSPEELAGEIVRFQSWGMARDWRPTQVTP